MLLAVMVLAALSIEFGITFLGYLLQFSGLKSAKDGPMQYFK